MHAQTYMPRPGPLTSRFKARACASCMREQRELRPQPRRDVGILGKSGSGKSETRRSMRLHPAHRTRCGHIMIAGTTSGMSARALVPRGSPSP